MRESTKKTTDRGYTVLEILVAVFILGLLLAAAIPNFQGMWSSYMRGNAIRELQSDLRRMRAEALREGSHGVMEIDLDGSGYSFGFDDLPFSDPPAIERPSFRRNISGQVHLSVDHDLVFDSKGIVVDSSGNISSCAFQLEQQGKIFQTLNLYSTGAMELN